MDIASRLRQQARQLTTAAVIIEETHFLFNQVQQTADFMTTVASSQEYVRTLARYHNLTPNYSVFLLRSAGLPYAFAGPTLGQFHIESPKDIKPRAVPTPGYALLPLTRSESLSRDCPTSH